MNKERYNLEVYELKSQAESLLVQIQHETDPKRVIDLGDECRKCIHSMALAKRVALLEKE